MEILYLLIPIAVIVMAVAVAALVWAVRSGQFEDLEGPAHRILMDDDDPRIPTRREARGDAGRTDQDRSDDSDKGST